MISYSRFDFRTASTNLFSLYDLIGFNLHTLRSKRDSINLKVYCVNQKEYYG